MEIDGPRYRRGSPLTSVDEWPLRLKQCRVLIKKVPVNDKQMLIFRTLENRTLRRELLAGRVLLKSRNIGIKLNPILLGTQPTVEHGDKALGVVERPCL